MSRTSWVAPGQGESLQTLLAYTVQNASPEVGLRAAQWMVENAATYQRYATARTTLALEITAAARGDDYDHTRVLAVLRDVDAQGPEEFFGADLVRASGGPELSLLDVGTRQARALSEGIKNLGRAIDRAHESRLAADESRKMLAVETGRLREEVAVLRRQLADKGVELAAPVPSFRDAWVVADADGLRLWGGHDWTADPSQAVRFTPEQVEDKVTLERDLAQQGLPAGHAYVVRDYGVEGRELWAEIGAVEPAPMAPEVAVEPLHQPGRGMADIPGLAAALPALGLSR